ncbi:MAG: hypothetical protein WDO12_14120 [Pseudomonadota bacterium]
MRTSWPGLRELKRRHKVIGDVDGLGLALRMEMCGSDGFTPDRALMDRMVDIGMSGTLDARGRKVGLVLDVGGYYKNVVTLAPSLEITHEEIDLGLELLEQCLTRALAQAPH